MNLVSSQLEANIDMVLRDYPDAKQMARDLHLNSKRFVIDLMNFMSQDYNSWKLQGYMKKEAWKMTCWSIHRILDDLQGARMTGKQPYPVHTHTLYNSSQRNSSKTSTEYGGY